MATIFLISNEESLFSVGELDDVESDVGLFGFNAVNKFFHKDVATGEQIGVRDDRYDVKSGVDRVIVNNSLFYLIFTVMDIVDFYVVNNRHYSNYDNKISKLVLADNIFVVKRM